MTGAICIDKSAGITSFNICRQLSKLYNEKKCGHTGTLDPLATGLMIVLLGGATRFAEFITSEDKHYYASFVLGKTTDTYDITGKVTGQYEINAGENEIKDLLPHFKGNILQTPPMYSAISVNGNRLYKLARAGLNIERTQRNVFIKTLDLVESENCEFTIDVVCSKGTYIRSLINDIGKELGCGAVMTNLRRIEYAGLSTEDAVTVERIKTERDKNQDIVKYIFPVDNLIKGNSVKISEKQSIRFLNGGSLDVNRIKNKLESGKLYKVYSPKNIFIGIGEVVEGELKVKRLLINK